MTSARGGVLAVVVALFVVSGCSGGGSVGESMSGTSSDSSSGEVTSDGAYTPKTPEPGRTDTPSKAELVAAITGDSSGLSVLPEQGDCVADLLLKSDLSDEALRRYTGDNPDYDFDRSDSDAFGFVQDHLGDCGVTLPGG